MNEYAGIYILQNTMVGGGGGDGWVGRKNENGVRGKKLKNGEKREENYMKKREMGLKNASFEEKA